MLFLLCTHVRENERLRLTNIDPIHSIMISRHFLPSLALPAFDEDCWGSAWHVWVIRGHHWCESLFSMLSGCMMVMMIPWSVKLRSAYQKRLLMGCLGSSDNISLNWHGTSHACVVRPCVMSFSIFCYIFWR